MADSLGRFRAAGEYAASTLALNGLGIAYSNQGLFDRARPYYEEYLRIAREVGYTRGIANALNNLGSNYARAGDAPRAVEYYRETYELAQLCGEPILIAVALSNLGSVSRALQQYDAAEGYYDQSLDISQTVGERRWTVASLNGLGLTLVEMGDHARRGPWSSMHCRLPWTSIAARTRWMHSPSWPISCSTRGQQTEGRAVFDYVANHKVTMSQARERSRARLQVLAASAESRAGRGRSSSSRVVGRASGRVRDQLPAQFSQHFPRQWDVSGRRIMFSVPISKLIYWTNSSTHHAKERT